MRVKVKTSMYPLYPTMMKWGSVKYAIQTSWKQNICKEKRKVDAKGKRRVYRQSKENNSKA